MGMAQGFFAFCSGVSRAAKLSPRKITERCARTKPDQTCAQVQAWVQMRCHKRKQPGRGRAVSRCRNFALLALASKPCFGLFAELGDLMCEAGDLAARGVLVNDVALCSAHQFGLGARHCLDRGIAIAALEDRKSNV